MSFLATGLQFLGGGSSWLGAAQLALSYRGYSGASQQADAIDQQGSVNAAIADIEAEQALIGAKDQERVRRDTLVKQVGTIRAQFASAGVDPGAGSPLLLIAETIEKGEQDIYAIQEQGNINAWRARMAGAQQVTRATQAAEAVRIGAETEVLSTGLRIGERLVKTTQRPAEVKIS